MTALNSAAPVEPGSAEGSLRPTVIVLAGDCRVLMADMDADSVDSIVTDAPYELGLMGSSWDSTGVAYDVETWRAAYRVIKPGSFLLSFGGSRTYHRMACAIEDAGFEIRDQIMWIYGSGFPKGGNRDGKGTCLKPAHEPIVMARKPFKGSVATNEALYGTGAINIDACRIHGDDAQGGTYTVKRLKPGATVEKTGGNWRPEEGGVEYHGEMKPGRWPANIIHDGHDDVVALFSAQVGGAAPASGTTRSDGFKSRAMAGAMKGIDTPAPFYGDTGSAARFFYCAKASKADRDEGLDAFDPQAFVQFRTGNGESGKASSLSDGRETQYRNAHPTVKPTALMRYLVRLVTTVGGTVLDPFTGSGSTGKAAVLEGRSFIGCELTEAYVPIAGARIAAAFVQADAEKAAANPPAPPLRSICSRRSQHSPHLLRLPAELGAKNQTGRCKSCATRKNNADPVLAEKRRQGIQRRLQDPEYRARHAASCADQNRNISDEVREQRRQHGYRMVEKLAATSRAVTPAMRAANGRKRSATVLAWCPPEWRAKYLDLTKRGRRAPVAKRIVLNLIRGIPEPIP